jgi:hypothetical protein
MRQDYEVVLLGQRPFAPWGKNENSEFRPSVLCPMGQDPLTLGKCLTGLNTNSGPTLVGKHKISG